MRTSYVFMKGWKGLCSVVRKGSLLKLKKNEKRGISCSSAVYSPFHAFIVKMHSMMKFLKI